MGEQLDVETPSPTQAGVPLPRHPTRSEKASPPPLRGRRIGLLCVVVNHHNTMTITFKSFPALFNFAQDNAKANNLWCLRQLPRYDESQLWKQPIPMDTITQIFPTATKEELEHLQEGFGFTYAVALGHAAIHNSIDVVEYILAQDGVGELPSVILACIKKAEQANSTKALELLHEHRKSLA